MQPYCGGACGVMRMNVANELMLGMNELMLHDIYITFANLNRV